VANAEDGALSGEEALCELRVEAAHRVFVY